MKIERRFTMSDGAKKIQRTMTLEAAAKLDGAGYDCSCIQGQHPSLWSVKYPSGCVRRLMSHELIALARKLNQEDKS